MSEANNQTTKKKGIGKLILGISILVVLIGLFVALWFVFGPKTTEGTKEVSLSVVYEAKTTKDYNTKTDALVLQDLMDELKDEGFTEADVPNLVELAFTTPSLDGLLDIAPTKATRESVAEIYRNSL